MRLNRRQPDLFEEPPRLRPISNERRVAFEFGEAERRTQCPDERVHDIGDLGYPFNRTGRFVSKGGSAKVAPSWADVHVVSAAWEEQPLGSGS